MAANAMGKFLAGFFLAFGLISCSSDLTPEPVETGSFTIRVLDYSLVQQGGNAVTWTIGVTRENFTGAVELDVEGVPLGVTVSITDPGTGSEGRITFQASSTAEVAYYPLRVVASSPALRGFRYLAANLAVIPAETPEDNRRLTAPAQEGHEAHPKCSHTLVPGHSFG